MSNDLEVIHNQAYVENLGEVLARPEELTEVPSFRIASYNVHNLFGDRPDVHSGQPGPPASPEQLKALAKMIVDLDADAIAFQEVQNERVLSDLIRKKVNPKLEKEARFTAFTCLPSHDPRGINVALATRFAVLGAMNFNAREFGPLEERAKKFSRDLLGVDMYATPTYRFIFLWPTSNQSSAAKNPSINVASRPKRFARFLRNRPSADNRSSGKTWYWPGT